MVMIMALLVPTLVHADGVLIPRSIKIEQFKTEMKELGMDLYGNDDSDGTVENLGTSMKVITYGSVTIEQLELIREVSAKNVRE